MYVLSEEDWLELKEKIHGLNQRAFFVGVAVGVIITAFIGMVRR